MWTKLCCYIVLLISLLVLLLELHFVLQQRDINYIDATHLFG